jgi:hypothetical protein
MTQPTTSSSGSARQAGGSRSRCTARRARRRASLDVKFRVWRAAAWYLQLLFVDAAEEKELVSTQRSPKTNAIRQILSPGWHRARHDSTVVRRHGLRDRRARRRRWWPSNNGRRGGQRRDPGAHGRRAGRRRFGGARRGWVPARHDARDGLDGRGCCRRSRRARLPGSAEPDVAAVIWARVGVAARRDQRGGRDVGRAAARVGHSLVQLAVAERALDLGGAGAREDGLGDDGAVERWIGEGQSYGLHEQEEDGTKRRHFRSLRF